MALIVYGLTQCPICKVPLDKVKPYIGTSGAAFPPNHPLYLYCDTGLHYECLETWSHREEFSMGYYQSSMKIYKNPRNGYVLKETDSWALVCGTDDHPPRYAQILLPDWIFTLYSKWENWETFLDQGYKGTLSGGALQAAERVAKEVRAVAPTTADLRRLLDEVKAKG